nr:L,D-transpeptidase [uncultured Niameybacter sp.]
MNYRRIFAMGLASVLFIQPLLKVSGSEVIEEKVQSEETSKQDDKIEDGFVNNQISIEELLKRPEWVAYSQRIERIGQKEGILTAELLGEMICYRLGLSPIYKEGENMYIERLKLEGLWPKELKGIISIEDYSSLMNGIALYTNKEEYIPFFEQVPAGILNKSSLQLLEGENKYTLYNLGDVNYVTLSDLYALGFSSLEVGSAIKLKYMYLGKQLPGIETEKPKGLSGSIALYNEQKIYIGNTLTYSLECNNEILIPLRSLGEYFTLDIKDNSCTLMPKMSVTSQMVELTQGKVTNVGNEPLDMEVVSLFWNGKEIIEETLTIVDLQPGETYPLYDSFYKLDETIIHTSTMIKTILKENEALSIPYKNYGQHTLSVLNNYSKNLSQDTASFVSGLFPATQIIGTMKYTTNGLVKGEKVVVWAAEDGKSYHIMKEGKKITVPWASVSIPPSPVSHKDKLPTEVVEAYFNSLNKTSKTSYYIWTDLYRQKTYVFQKKKGEWKLIRTMLTSTGLNKTPTPTGEFVVNAYVPAFGMDKGYQCKTALHLFGDYLYHSVLFDVKGKYIISGLDKLGERASHGCLRLSPEDSKWLYETMPLGTGVMIR